MLQAKEKKEKSYNNNHKRIQEQLDIIIYYEDVVSLVKNEQMLISRVN